MSWIEQALAAGVVAAAILAVRGWIKRSCRRLAGRISGKRMRLIHKADGRIRPEKGAPAPGKRRDSGKYDAHTD